MTSYDQGDSPTFALTILAVADLGRAAAFYRAAFGWRVRVEVPVYVEFELPGGTGVGLYQREAFAANTGHEAQLPPPGGVGGTELYFRTEDLEDACKRIEDAGGRLLAPLAPKDWGDEVAYYADPDGNVIAIARRIQ